jgi:hypothetical protein
MKVFRVKSDAQRSRASKRRQGHVLYAGDYLHLTLDLSADPHDTYSSSKGNNERRALKTGSGNGTAGTEGSRNSRLREIGASRLIGDERPRRLTSKYTNLYPRMRPDGDELQGGRPSDRADRQPTTATTRTRPATPLGSLAEPQPWSYHDPLYSDRPAPLHTTMRGADSIRTTT